VLVAQDGPDMARLLHQVQWDEAHQIGARGRARALRDHSYASRAHLLDAYLTSRLSGS